MSMVIEMFYLQTDIIAHELYRLFKPFLFYLS